jgi:hypothetical protein
MDYAYRRPLLGFYDLMQPDVVAAEIELMAWEGINFAAFYHYIDATTGLDSSSLNAPIPLFFNSPNRSKMKFALAPIIGADQPGKILSEATWKAVTVPILVKYVSSDSYYRVNGKPLIFDFAWAAFASQQDKINAYADLRTAVQAAVGVEPIIIQVLPADAGYDALWWQWKMIGADGFTCFVSPMKGGPQD